MHHYDASCVDLNFGSPFRSSSMHETDSSSSFVLHKSWGGGEPPPPPAGKRAWLVGGEGVLPQGVHLKM